MSLKIHFISGLPRSGSTVLAAILRQNPRFHAAMSGPLCGIFEGLLQSMGEANDYSLFLAEAQRERIARSLFEAYYADLADRLIFDTNRGWTGQLSALAQLFPEARVLCCVRSPAWILDSFERRVQQAPLRRGKMFKGPASVNAYARVESLVKGGALGSALQMLRQAWSGEWAGRLVVIRYETLSEQPALVMGRLYELLGEEPFAHDFEHVEYDAPEFDERLGLPGLHRVAARVQPHERKTILPADLFSQHDRSFWDVPGQNPRGVTVL
jgi:sulfotransferase